MDVRHPPHSCIRVLVLPGRSLCAAGNRGSELGSCSRETFWRRFCDLRVFCNHPLKAAASLRF